MKDILDMTVTQIRVFAADALPFAELRRTDNMKAVKEAFRFESAQPDPFGMQLVFGNGGFDHEGKSIHILSLAIEQRRVLTHVRGSSAAADAFYSSLADRLAKIRGLTERQGVKPLLKTDETACVATLDIDFEDLVAPRLLRFIRTYATNKLGTKFGDPKSVAFKNLSFEVRYGPVSPALEGYDVSLSNKVVTFEPRAGTPLRERRFFTSSPTDSETHVQILKALEKEMSRSSKANSV